MNLHSDFHVVLTKEWRSHGAVLLLAKLHFPCLKWISTVHSPCFIGAIFFFSIQGRDFQDSQTTDIKERARLESRLIHTTRDVVFLREEIKRVRIERKWKNSLPLAEKVGASFYNLYHRTLRLQLPVQKCYLTILVTLTINSGSSHAWKCKIVLAIQGFSCKGLYLFFLSKYNCSNR